MVQFSLQTELSTVTSYCITAVLIIVAAGETKYTERQKNIKSFLTIVDHLN